MSVLASCSLESSSQEEKKYRKGRDLPDASMVGYTSRSSFPPQTPLRLMLVEFTVQRLPYAASQYSKSDHRSLILR